MKHSPSSLMRYFVSPYEAWMYKYLKEVDPDAAHEDPEDPFMQVASRKGDIHEEKLFNDLRDEVDTSIVIVNSDPDDMFAATKEAMTNGIDLIYQGALKDDTFFGRADFLFKVEGHSRFGNYCYEIWDAKLANKSKPQYLLQLCCYSELLSSLQQKVTPSCVLVYGNSERERFNIEEYFTFYKAIKERYLKFHESFTADEQPNPENYTDWGRFTNHAKGILKERDHLLQIAGIRQSQVLKLNSVGITTMHQLAETDSIESSKINEKSFNRLQSQAKMQIKSEETGRISYGVLDNMEPGLGLYSLPPKSNKDIYFDIESNTLLTKLPLHYLWGAAHEDNQEGFNCWWAHSELEMKQAFEDFIDWVFERWSADNSMHIYHYGQFEITALRTLMGHFGTREEKVDQLLNNEVFIDLIRVVKQSLCVGSKGYGLKEIEPLYREDRIGEVTSALDSTVTYEVWSADRGDTRDHTNSDLLKEIWDYNKDDCISLIRLSDFLREVQLEKGFTYSSVSATETGTEEEKDTSETIKELINNLQNNENKPHAKILANLCLFHRREYKPKAWRMYDRFGSTDQDLVNDLDCLADLLATGKIEALEKPSRSCVYEYSFDPNQESKIKIGDWLVNKADGPRSKQFEIYALDLKEGLLKIKSTSELSNHLTLIPRDQYFGGPIQDSIQKIASEYLEGNELNPCLENFLSRKRPNFKKDHDEDLSSWGKNTLDSAIRVATELDGGYFCMQGPPGTGKTHVGSRLISALVKSGARIGLSSNSHKAINNLLEKVISTMDQEKVEGEIVRIHNLKDHEDEPLYEDSRINRFKNIRESVISEDTNIIAGTAWVFSNDKMNNQLDYLFIDEAGQVSLANLVGMSHSTKNLILMGDQMQLGQPIQGVHPEDAGCSSLEYLLGDLPTIPKDIGMFLPKTFRLHPDICEFVSTRVYEGRLSHDSRTEERKLNLKPGSSISRSSGIFYVPVDHFGNEQSSGEEIEVIKDLVKELMSAKKTEEGGLISQVAPEDLLIVAPYNHQVRNLQESLGKKFNIGTVDKFQGREAPVVIISMTASDIESAPRGAEFLLDRNRLNVALTRAQSLSIIVGSPYLIIPYARSVKEMRLVNFYLDLVNHSYLGIE